MFVENVEDIEQKFLTSWYSYDTDSIEIMYLGKDFDLENIDDSYYTNYEKIKSWKYFKMEIFSNGRYYFENSLHFLKGDDIKFKVKEFDYFNFHKLLEQILLETNK